MRILKNWALKVGNKRAESISKFLMPLIEGSGQILDIGCGPAHLGYTISKLTKRKITYLDIKRKPFTHPKVKLEFYDGKKIPYKDNSFETCLCLFTLHHTCDPINILKEIRRVTSRNVIIAEDYLISRNQMIFEVIKDLIANFFYTRLTFQYHTENEWENIFKQLEFKVIKKIYFEDITKVKIKHIAWLLGIYNLDAKDGGRL